MCRCPARCRHAVLRGTGGRGGVGRCHRVGLRMAPGRAIEERPPWGFAKRLADRLASVDSTLDIDTGGGEVVSEAPILPRRMFVTEGWPPNARRARALLGPRGVHVVSSRGGGPVPFPDESFDLVTSPAPGVGGLAGDWPSSRPRRSLLRPTRGSRIRVRADRVPCWPK